MRKKPPKVRGAAGVRKSASASKAAARAKPKRSGSPRARPPRRAGAKAAPLAEAAQAPAELTAQDLDALREELRRKTDAQHGPSRWNADPADVQRSVARLVLALVEFVRRLMEKQAIRRMEAGTLSDPEIEKMGVALMKLEETLREMAERFGLKPEDLNLDLGPLGRLL